MHSFTTSTYSVFFRFALCGSILIRTFFCCICVWMWLSSAVFTHLRMIKCVRVCERVWFLLNIFQVNYSVLVGFDVFIYKFERISLFMPRKMCTHINIDFVSMCPHEGEEEIATRARLYSCKSIPLHSHD